PRSATDPALLAEDRAAPPRHAPPRCPGSPFKLAAALRFPHPSPLPPPGPPSSNPTPRSAPPPGELCAAAGTSAAPNFFAAGDPRISLTLVSPPQEHPASI